MFGIIGRIVIEAAILRVILRLIAKHEADLSIPKTVMVTCGIIIGGFIVNMMVVASYPNAGLLVQLLIDFVLAVFLITTFCWVSWAKSLVIVFLYFMFHIGVTIGAMFIMFKIKKENFKFRFVKIVYYS